MHRKVRVRVAGAVRIALLLLATQLLLPNVWADEPMLAVRLTGGESSIRWDFSSVEDPKEAAPTEPDQADDSKTGNKSAPD